MFRVSIRRTMAVIVALAVAIAALREAGEVWAGILSLLTALALGYALLAVIYLRGRGRAGWLGFGVFSAGYLVLALGSGPWGLGDGRLATSQLLRLVHERVAPPRATLSSMRSLQLTRSQYVSAAVDMRRRVSSSSDPSVVRMARRIANIDSQIRALQSSPPAPAVRFSWRSAFPGAADLESFERVGHCVFAALSGLIGAFLARRLHARGRRNPFLEYRG